MNCRPECGACCRALSISSAIPGMPNGKPAGIPCVHLTARMECNIFESPHRPRVCESLRPSEEMCGKSRDDALAYLRALEAATAPQR
ncbi:MAG TPA: YkgJ family cysteine cluster protein [Chitinivibrionales bacterium]